MGSMDDQQSNEIVAGHVRVTVLTDRLVRIEYAPDAIFEDRPSLTVVDRDFPAVNHRVERHDASLTIDTGVVRLRITDVTRPFTSRTLSAEIGGPEPARWSYGKAPRRNLGGTVRTLDNWRGRTTARVTGFDPVTGFEREWDEQSLGDGLLSRDGWVVVDDTGSVVLDPDTGAGRPWPVARPAGERTDLYLFAYGDDHRAALAAASKLLGPQPLPPRHTLGYWYSRYYAYTDTELIELADQLDHYGIPTDVLVIDMDWHRPGWTGYSWDHDLIPDPTATLAELRRRGLKVALNLHPAEGVGAHEDAFAEVCGDLGLDPAVTDRVPFDVTDPAFVDTYLRRLHHPEEDRGVDIWWMDWQQGTETALSGLDPLAWLNHIHWQDQVERRPDRRPVIFSRWGGLGAGRNPIGFSGDTWAVWESLAFQPEFTATAANVLYGYWSHDIGGHFGVGEADPELYTRWLQWGTHSPIVRTHGTLGLQEERRVWEYPNPYRDVMIDAIRRRYELVPYLYGECRRGVDDGTSLVRPMYHDHPEAKAAYRAPRQVLFGSDLVVAPIAEARGDDGMAPVRVWLPEGAWYDTARGHLVEVTADQGRWVSDRYLLDETPVFARAGAVVPGQQGVSRLDERCYPNLVLTVYPGGSGRHDLYEDDGGSQGYLRGESVIVPVEHRLNTRDRRVVVGGAEGDYDGWRRERDVEVRFVGEPPPRSVSVDGREVAWSPKPAPAPAPAPGQWWFEASTATVVVSLPALDLREGATISLNRGGSERHERVEGLLDGLPGLHRRLKALADSTRTLVADDNRRFVALARAVERISTEPDTTEAEVSALVEALPELDRLLRLHLARCREIETLNPEKPPLASEALGRALRLLATTRRQVKADQKR